VPTFKLIAMKEKIVCAAIWYKDLPREIDIRGFQPFNINQGIVVCGLRHGNCIATVKELSGLRTSKLAPDSVGETVQGFITTENRFVDREEAYNIASDNNQIINEFKPCNNRVLFTEDLY